ncbi:hypothetical protein SBI_00228 [Streptomyces bingchenggensis BCW-1]|uniref:Uncharacterized protein n=1 Tax=Streptomyces bingchenggensis (strain BCW-1) TaxID=749414 RepID=D7BWJ3_STRBB|nr:MULTISPECIES: hypothetical protein [Streptomyces]ADI03349.1 hypothetical protein SBI_00228 [Streptomyces bingchenggensis BCW-1]
MSIGEEATKVAVAVVASWLDRYWAGFQKKLHQEAMTLINSEANALKLEATAFKGEANLATYSFKVAGKDINLLELFQERRAEREAQQTIDGIKSSIAELKERVDHLHDFVKQDVESPLKQLHSHVHQALTERINQAVNQAHRANSRLDALRTQVSRSAPQQQAHIGNTRSFSEAAERINHLEARIDSLAQALG